MRIRFLLPLFFILVSCASNRASKCAGEECSAPTETKTASSAEPKVDDLILMQRARSLTIPALAAPPQSEADKRISAKWAADNAKKEAGKMPIERGGGIRRGECYDARTMGGYFIGQRLDAHHYELVGDGTKFEPHGILTTKTLSFDKPGRPIGIFMKLVGMKEIPMENGFPGRYFLWEECGYDKTYVCDKPGEHFFGPDVAVAKLKKCPK